MKLLEIGADLLLDLDTESLAEIILRTYSSPMGFNRYNVGLSYERAQLRGCAKIKWHFAVFSSGQWCSSRPEVLSGWIGESL